MTTNRIGSQIQPEIKEKARALKLFREKKQKLRSQANYLQLINNEENSDQVHLTLKGSSNRTSSIRGTLM